jgi:hypothetical protein
VKQLRLVDQPSPAPKPRKGRVVRASTARRPVNLGEWRLDARTRTVGRRGVAAARRALEQARPNEPWQQAS